MHRDVYQGADVHGLALVDYGAHLGARTRVWPFAHVQCGAIVGMDCNLGEHVFIEKGAEVGDGVTIKNGVSVWDRVKIGDHVFCGPHCVFTNVKNPRAELSRKNEFQGTLVRRGATIGANATIMCGTTIGRYAFVGAGAVVAKDVGDFELVVGVPAKHAGWMSAHGHRLQPRELEARCPESGWLYRLECDGTRLGKMTCPEMEERGGIK
jgi:UDP-2-acetamido-3-amino-2,3-dideoxy-glucuronate N-acetyltransferase